MFWMHFLRGQLNFWFITADSCGCCFILSGLSISVACLFLFACTHFYLLLILSVRTYFYSCILVWMPKHQKYWYFFCWRHCDMNTKSWIVILSHITILRQNHEYLYLSWQYHRLKLLKNKLQWTLEP